MDEARTWAFLVPPAARDNLLELGGESVEEGEQGEPVCRMHHVARFNHLLSWARILP